MNFPTLSRPFAWIGLVLWTAQAFAQDPGLVAHWTFGPERTLSGRVKPVAGGPDAAIRGGARFLKDPGPSRVELAGRDEELVVTEDHTKAVLPIEAISVVAWARVDRPQPWGGLLSALQDNGDFERGWLLGFVNDRFAFALASTNGGRLTYLTADQPFATNHWHQVAGTYDGSVMRLYVNGRLAGTATNQSGPILYPPRAPVVLGAYRDEDEHYRLAGALHGVRLYRRTLTPEAIAKEYAERRAAFPEPAPAPILFKPAYGPFVDWIDRTTAEVTWETEEPMPTRLELERPDGTVEKLGDGMVRQKHAVRWVNLQPNLEHYYRLLAPPVEGRPVQSRRMQFDTSFHYAPAVVAPSRPSADLAWLTSWTASHPATMDGYALVAGAVDGRLALELVRHSRLKVVVVEPDPARVAAARRTLEDAGVYGVRASVHRQAGDVLPYGDLFANLITSERTWVEGTPPTVPVGELERLLRPSGGTAFLRSSRPVDPARWDGWLAGSSWAKEPRPEAGAFQLLFTRARLPGSGEWTHQYGNADNSACSQDELVRGELRVAWWGDPGPRPMPDRGNRNPAPLSVNGRLFVQGNRILFGLDAYNGAILWSLSAPEVRRANVTRDSSNMAAFGDRLYVAHRRYCLALDGQTGARTRRYEVVEDSPAGAHEWGYLAAGDGWLVGSRVKRDSMYLGDDGEWYEDFATDQVSRIGSDRLFSLDTNTGAARWVYQGGLILNSTVTIADGMIFFIESRNPAALQQPSSRVPIELLTDQQLVCLDLQTGRRVWQKPHDFSACQFMTYLVYGGNTVVVTGTDRDKNYHTFAFSAPAVKPATGTGDDVEGALGGRLLWQDVHKEDKGHHSGHLQHPLVIGDTFFSDQRAFELKSGKLVRKDLPERRGCGVMSAGKNAVFFRHHFHGMWDLETNSRTQFEGIRGGCWLGLIPAGGFLLAPESSAGCSCTHAIQTSVGYIPTALLARRAPAKP